jgi:hypothetical protein
MLTRTSKRYEQRIAGMQVDAEREAERMARLNSLYTASLQVSLNPKPKP